VILGLFVVLLALFVILPVLGMTLWALISTIVVGLVIGALGRLIVPGPTRIGFLATVICGLMGAIIGGFLGNQVFDVNGFATTLLEIGIAAIFVAVLTRTTAYRHLSRSDPRYPPYPH
jgi:uncharacterized membrane protein YeaQ/YmgE (transglycosylase-associated protein family)